MYTKSSIKKYKGQLIRLECNGMNNKSQTGKITAITSEYILFMINNEHEKPIKISKINSIEELRPYSKYLRMVKSNLLKNEPQKALDILNEIKDIFNLDEQIEEIEKLRLKCMEILWKRKRPETKYKTS